MGFFKKVFGSGTAKPTGAGVLGSLPVVRPASPKSSSGNAASGHSPTASVSRPMDVAVLGGSADLKVVGESYRQNELWSIIGNRTLEPVHQDVCAVLIPEPNNEYDKNAVAVHVNGLMVGYLAREDAARLRPGVVRLTAEYGKPIALSGVIAGREGNLGVFLNYDANEFAGDTPLAPGQAAPIHGKSRIDLVYANAGNLAKIREKGRSSFVVGEGLVQVDSTGRNVEVLLDGLKVGRFAADDRREFLESVKSWGRPLAATVKAGDHDGRSDWDVWVEVDTNRLASGGA